MKTVCAIYGYEFTKEFSYRDMRFVPLHSWFADVQDKARDLKSYQLTGVVVLDKYDAHQVFCLEAVLSFIEHLDVLISDPREIDQEDLFNPFPPVARVAQRHDGGGALLMQDAFSAMRSNFIPLAMDRLADDNFCESTGWRTLFFKATEPFRQRRPFLEVSYFLLFSGLETYVRRTLNEPDSTDIAVLITRRLRQLGFEIHSYKPHDLKRSADSYARLRNALFHNSSMTTTRKSKNGSVVAYNLVEYYAHFMILVGLVVLKGAGFEHPDFSWDTWITFQQ